MKTAFLQNIKGLWLIALLLSSPGFFAQADTALSESSSDSLRIYEPADYPLDTLANDTVREPIKPGKAALYSAILPGLGQVYNQKYWKVPIIYAALAGVGYGIWFNSREAQTYLNAFYEQTDPAVDEPAFEGIYNESQLIQLYYQYRQWQDLSIILGGVAYGLQILDAYVDAHLFYYDISDDLTLRWEPRMIRITSNPSPAPGLGISIDLK